MGTPLFVIYRIYLAVAERDLFVLRKKKLLRCDFRLNDIFSVQNLRTLEESHIVYFHINFSIVNI